MEEVLGVVVFKFWMKFYPKMGKKAPKMGLLGKKVPLYSNLLQGAVIIKTAVVFTPIRYLVKFLAPVEQLCIRTPLIKL